MRGDMPPLSNTSSWRGAELSNTFVFIAWYLVKHSDFVLLYVCVQKHTANHLTGK